MHKQKLLASPQMDAILMWQRRPILQPTGPTNGWPTQPRRKSLSNREKQKCWLEVGPKLTYIGRAMDTENKRWYAKIQICPNSSYKQALTANTAADEIDLSTKMDPTSFIETTHCSDLHSEAKITQRKGKKNNIQEGGGYIQNIHIYTVLMHETICPAYACECTPPPFRFPYQRTWLPPHLSYLDNPSKQ